MTPGKHIALEGLAANHTELLRRLHAELVATHVPVKFLPTSWESSDLTAQTIGVVLQTASYPKSLRTHSLLNDATLSVQRETIRTELDGGVHCVTGRGTLTALVCDYYGLGVANDYQQMTSIIDFAGANQAADLTIVLDTPVVTLGKLTAEELYLPAGTEPDAALLERLRAGYLWEAKQRNLPVIVVDGDTNHTFDQIWQLVANFLDLRTTPRAVDTPHSVAEILAANPPQQKQTTEQAKPFASDSFGTATPKGSTPPDAVTPLLTPPISSLASAYLLTGQVVTKAAESYRYDTKDEAGHYRYYLPAELKGKVRSQYIRTMNQQFEVYAEMAASLKAYISKTLRPEDEAYETLRNVLPLAATMNLQTATNTSTDIVRMPSGLSETNELVQAFSGQLTTVDDQKLNELAMELLPPNFTAEGEAVRLEDFQPRNELDLAADALYEYTDLPRTQVHSIASSWTYQQKADALALYSEIQGISALDAANYTFDLTTPFTALYDLLAASSLSGAHWQLASPRLGYKIPWLIEEAGLSDHYEACFDRSLELYSALHSAKDIQLAQYAVLQGHKIRWTCTITLRHMRELIRNLGSLQRKQGENNILQQMFEKIAEVHPLIAENLIDKQSL